MATNKKHRKLFIIILLLMAKERQKPLGLKKKLTEVDIIHA